LKRIVDVESNGRKNFITAKAFAKMGEVLLEMDQPKAAQEQFTKSHAMLLELAETDQETAESIHQLRLGRSFRNLGRAAERLEGPEAAYALYWDSLKSRDAALPTADDAFLVKQEIAGSYGDLGRMALDLGRPREALEYATKAIANLKGCLTRFSDKDQSLEKEDLLRANAGAHSLLGHAHLNLGDPTKSLEQFEIALPLLRDLAEKYKSSITDPTNVALCYNDIGTAYLFAGNPITARENCEEARVRLEPIYRANSGNTSLNRFLLKKLGKVYYGLATASQELNHPNAVKDSERSVAARKLQFQKTPHERNSRQDLMLSLARDGQVAEADTHAKVIAQEAPKAPDALFMVACTYALCAAAKDRETPTTTPGGNEYRKFALAALGDAVKAGHQAPAMLKLDPDLAGVRGDAEFQKLIRDLEDREKLADNQPK
jgi:tetratricopeptide (TPR) repeat protein